MKKDKYQVEAEYWRECYQSAKTSNTSIRAWMKENAPDVWRKYEENRLLKYIIPIK